MSSTPKDLWLQTGKVFQDPVHGSVELHDVLVKFIDTPAFQRLRWLLQTGPTYLVYPGACHKRFEHSIGVCHLSALMLDALEKNSPSEMAEVTSTEKLAVLIAGLCHDLGHGPFSHSWEVFVGFAGKTFKHEELSKTIFLHMLQDRGGELRQELLKYNFQEREISLILELIDGRGDTLPAHKKFLYQIVANKTNDIDVDKWDYFLRDGKSFGVKVTFDYQRLLKFTKVKVDAEDGVYSIAFRDKERFSIEDMFRMRADLHTRAYQHPVVKKIEAMIMDALLEADQHFQFEAEGQKTRLSDVHKSIPLFLRLDDNIISEIKKKHDPRLKEAKEILERIDRRELYFDVDCYDVNYLENGNTHSPKPVSGKFWADMRKEVLESFNVHVIPAQILITTGKFGDPINRVEFYSKSKAKTRSAPRTRYDLPYSKIYLFSRELLDDETKQKLSIFCVEKLVKAGVAAKKTTQ